MIDKEITDRLAEFSSRKSAWLGKSLTVPADLIQMDPEKNYRLSPEMHGQYEAVWICEWNLFDIESWALILDEALRLLGKSGKLVLRTRNSATGTLWEIKSYIFRHPARKATMIWQMENSDGHMISVMDIERLDYSMYTSSRWSVGILSNGSRKKNVTDLINKMINRANGIALEFLVVGPFEPSSTIKPDLVQVIETKDWDDLPRIGQKKHLIAKAASYENVAIFHDRYQIRDDFFTGFHNFGYDFDFATVMQFYEDGTILPCYMGTLNRTLRWSTVCFHESPGILFEGHTVQGGLMIFKKNILQRVNFNPLLLHFESEEFEISCLLRDLGVVPRLNIFSSAISLVSPPYIATISRVSRKTFLKKLPLAKRIWDKYPGLRKSFQYGRLHKFFLRFYTNRQLP